MVDAALVNAAEDYLGAGLHILALAGKRPNPAIHPTFSYENSAWGSPEGAEASGWLEEAFGHPDTTGVGLLVPEHMLVADIDTDEAAALFYELAGALPGAAVSRTAHGLHVWYLAPGAAKTYWLGGRTLMLRGLGGYVVAPPSRHPEGPVYEWIDPLIVDGRVSPDFLPERMTEAMALIRARDAERESDAEAGGGSSHWVVELDEGRHMTALRREWDLEGLERAIVEAPEGNQNNMISWAAMAARDDGVPFDVAMDRLLAAAIRGNHPRDRAVATIRGAYRRARG